MQECLQPPPFSLKIYTLMTLKNRFQLLHCVKMRLRLPADLIEVKKKFMCICLCVVVVARTPCLSALDVIHPLNMELHFFAAPTVTHGDGEPAQQPGIMQM